MSSLKSPKFEPPDAAQERKEVRGVELNVAKEFPVEERLCTKDTLAFRHNPGGQQRRSVVQNYDTDVVRTKGPSCEPSEKGGRYRL
jgi:hypothetical protein